MKKRHYLKRVIPKTMITRFQEIFKPVSVKKPAFRNLPFILIAISVAKTFRINEIAARLPLTWKERNPNRKGCSASFYNFGKPPRFSPDGKPEIIDLGEFPIEIDLPAKIRSEQ